MPLPARFAVCFYLELECPTDGAVRCAIEGEPGDHHPCPLCGRLSPCGFLGYGFTRRELPFHERIMAALPPAFWPKPDPSTPPKRKKLPRWAVIARAGYAGLSR